MASEDGRDVRHTDDKLPVAAGHTGHAQEEQRPWTPLPDPFDAETYTAWGRKHYGEDWYELRETMLRERNFVERRRVQDDVVFLIRQCALRKMEREREEGKLLLDEGMTFQEVLAWARWHYGERWYEMRQAFARHEHAANDQALDPDVRETKQREADALARDLSDMQLERDMEVLASGKTWDEILAWPPTAKRFTLVDLIDQSPPPPIDAFRVAFTGPQFPEPREKLVWRNKSNWGHLQLEAIRSRMTEELYESGKWEFMQFDLLDRSKREEEEAYERDMEVQEGFRRTLWAGPYLEGYGKFEDQMRERVESMKALDLRHQAWIREQINALPRSQEEMDQRFDRWEIQGLTTEEGNCLARMYGFPERLSRLSTYQVRFYRGVWPLPPRGEERVEFPILYRSCASRSPPKDEAMMEERFREWDGVLSHAEQNELARMYGFRARWSSPEGDDEPREQQRRPSLPAEDAAHRALGGRITRKTRPVRRGIRSGTGHPRVGPPQRKRPRKIYTKERASRRLAGQLPEFDMNA